MTKYHCQSADKIQHRRRSQEVRKAWVYCSLLKLVCCHMDLCMIRLA